MQPAGEAAWPRSKPGAADDVEADLADPGPGFEQIWQPIWQTACELGVGACRKRRP